MALAVDDIKDEIGQYAPDIDWLTNSYAYVGGMPRSKNVPITLENFRGCVKKVSYPLVIWLSLAFQLLHCFQCDLIRKLFDFLLYPS